MKVFEINVQSSEVSGLPLPELSDAERAEYSYSKAIAVSGGMIRGNSLEREYNDAAQQAVRARGFLVPLDVDAYQLQRHAALKTTSPTAGGNTVFVGSLGFLDLLRARSVCASLGATIMIDAVLPGKYPSQANGTAAVWVAEDPGSNLTETDAEYDGVEFTLKTLGAGTAFSRQLLAQAVGQLSTELIVRRDLAGRIAGGWDKGAIQGSGASNQPFGLLQRTTLTGTVTASGSPAVTGSGTAFTTELAVGQRIEVNGAVYVVRAITSNTALTIDRAATFAGATATRTSGITVVAIGANGGAPTNVHITDLEAQVALANGDVGSLGFATTPVMRRKLRRTEAATGSGMLWGDAGMLGYRSIVSTNMPSALTKGTSPDCHPIAFGNWQDVVIASKGVIDLIVDPVGKKKQGLWEVDAFWYGDIGLARPGSLAAILDARDV